MPGGAAQAEAVERYKLAARDKRKIPPVDESGLLEERELYRKDLLQFCKVVMPQTFSMDFAPCHIEVLRGMQHAILHGGKKAVALPRGSGKTAMSIGAMIWGMLYGHIRYGAIIAADQGAADKILASLKTELWLSDHIGRLWPYLQAYCRRGEGDGNKYRHILNYDDTPPLIKWGTAMLKLPTVPDDEGKHDWHSAVVQSKGLTSGVRGMQYKLPSGETLRPDFALIDDPQTKDSARSVSQTDYREEIVDGDVLGLAGPQEPMSAFMTCTVIEPNDLAEKYLDRKIHGDWNGTRIPMIIDFPDEVDGMWEEYRIRYMKALREERLPDDAFEYYVENREAMDAGSKVYWDDRKLKADISALQHAMHLRFQRGNQFLSEFQNEPVTRYAGKPYQIDTIAVMEKCNGRARRDAPDDALMIVSMTDINHSGLNTVVVAATNDAVRYVVDYQTYPGEGKVLYDPSRKKKNDSDALAIARALDVHIPDVGSARYHRGGKLVAPDLVLIDCGNWMDLVFRWCHSNAHKVKASRVFPSRGRADSQYRPSQLVGKPGDGWHVADWKNRGRVLVHNADQWRMRSQQSFLVPNAVPGTVSLFGKVPSFHKRIADEICSEILSEYIELTDGGNTMYKWTRKIGVANDLLDSVVGAFVGLSYLGASEHKLADVRGATPQQPRNRRRGRRVSKIKV